MSDKLVLIVDDEPNIRQIVQMVVEELAGARTMVAGDGEEAIDRLSYARPDLVLLDLMIPKLDGFEVLRRLKANPTTQNIPVVALTACGRDKYQPVLTAGCAAIVAKPFDVDELAAHINICLSSASRPPQPGGLLLRNVSPVDALVDNPVIT